MPRSSLICTCMRMLWARRAYLTAACPGAPAPRMPDWLRRPRRTVLRRQPRCGGVRGWAPDENVVLLGQLDQRIVAHVGVVAVAVDDHGALTDLVLRAVDLQPGSGTERQRWCWVWCWCCAAAVLLLCAAVCCCGVLRLCAAAAGSLPGAGGRPPSACGRPSRWATAR